MSTAQRVWDTTWSDAELIAFANRRNGWDLFDTKLHANMQTGMTVYNHANIFMVIEESLDTGKESVVFYGGKMDCAKWIRNNGYRPLGA